MKEDTNNWSPIRALIGGGTERTFAPPKIGTSESDNRLLRLFPVKGDIVNNFAFPNGFINNISAVYEGKRPFYCIPCNQTFIRKFSLRRHVASYHEGKKPYFYVTCKVAPRLVRPQNTSGTKIWDISGRETLPALKLLDKSGPEFFGQVQP